MLVGTKYKIESDNLNITLSLKGTSKNTGNVYWRPIAYFSSFANALKHLVDLEVVETELKDFRTVVEKQKELYQLIIATEPRLGNVTACKKGEKRGVAGKTIGGKAK